MAPTILYGLGLPVAQDFAGRPRTGLFTAEFRRAHPAADDPDLGDAAGGRRGAAGSKADEDLLNELRSLGYIR